MTRYAYVLIISGTTKSRSDVQKFLDTRPEIINWYANLPNAIFLISEKTATELHESLKPFLINDNYIILDVDTDRNGWMPKKTWDFLKGKKAPWEV